MTKRLVEIDDTELSRAQDSGGYSTIKATVAAGLRELAATAARRREIERLTGGSLAAFADESVRAEAWR